jgi:hypothetical protein
VNEAVLGSSISWLALTFSTEAAGVSSGVIDAA